MKIVLIIIVIVVIIIIAFLFSYRVDDTMVLVGTIKGEELKEVGPRQVIGFLS